MITDTHSHVFWKSFDSDREEVLERARANGVSRMLVVGTDLETSRAAFALCAGREGMFPTAGCHPHDAEGFGDEDKDAIRALAERPECVAVGETGLDYFKEYSPRAEQHAGFRWHTALAAKLDKPLVVHCRDAHEDTVKILSEVPGVRGVMHCFTYGPEEMQAYLDLGFYMSFSGVVTYPKNKANMEAARQVPRDRMLIETDCPFLAPQGQRGKRNEPSFVRHVLEHVAALRGEDPESLGAATHDNATQLFQLV